MLGYLGESLARKFGYENFYQMQMSIDSSNPRKGKKIVKQICGPLLFFHEGQIKDDDKSHLDHSYLYAPANLERIKGAVLQIPPKPGPLAKMQRFLHKVSPSGTMTSIIKWYEQATAFPS